MSLRNCVAALCRRSPAARVAVLAAANPGSRDFAQCCLRRARQRSRDTISAAIIGRLPTRPPLLENQRSHVIAPDGFPPLLSVEELDACFVVKDSAGQKLSYVYFEEKPGQRSAAKLLTKDEARRIGVNIAKLPELVR